MSFGKAMDQSGARWPQQSSRYMITHVNMRRGNYQHRRVPLDAHGEIVFSAPEYTPMFLPRAGCLDWLLLCSTSGQPSSVVVTPAVEIDYT